ncbi:MAG: TrmH family RNA methyltransferase [Gammaproteobacteria bacterium]|nr:TrmH family RNA methyltransferase [Gammaproteobacteria bacterium]
MNKLKASIGLSNPKNPENVNSVRRAAGNFCVDSIFYTGSRYPRAVRLNPEPPNMSREVSRDIPVIGVSCLINDTPKELKIVCVEFAEDAIPLPGYQHPDNALYIFGPEDGTLSQALIDKADAVVYVPTQGCMNLAATVNVVLYDRLTKSSQCFEGNELIFQSRDTNNNLKTKK